VRGAYPDRYQNGEKYGMVRKSYIAVAKYSLPGA
jgi:hypothetical protein